MTAEYGSLPFEEANTFFREKLNVPTPRWNALFRSAHAKAFTVAGALKEDLLIDLRKSVQKGIVDGTTLQTFRKEFDEIVQRHGWGYKGGRNWRTRVIYDTNLRSAYAAGRWKQFQDTATTRPYLRYRHGDSRVPRPEHLKWDGLILRHDDPWWSTHYPPNGWGCSCYAESLSDRELKAKGLAVSTPPPEKTYKYRDKATGKTIEIPVGIDPGFDFNIGEASLEGRSAPARIVPELGRIEPTFRPLIRTSFSDLGRPAVPFEPPKARLGPPLRGADEITRALVKQFGDPLSTVRLPTGELVIDARFLAEHLALKIERTRYLPFLPELLDAPFEIWLQLLQGQTGQLAMRQYLVKGISLPAGKERGLIGVAEVQGNRLVAYNFLHTSDRSYLDRTRSGLLLWPKAR